MVREHLVARCTHTFVADGRDVLPLNFNSATDDSLFFVQFLDCSPQITVEVVELVDGGLFVDFDKFLCELFSEVKFKFFFDGLELREVTCHFY